jgi:putative hydrolase of HD superfamily
MSEKQGKEPVASFLFETAMLKRVERTGYAFLGTGRESVAAHVYGMSVAALVLSCMRRDVDRERMLLMCLVHDMPEARTGDANAVHKLYLSRDEQRAIEDMSHGLPFEDVIMDAWKEFAEGSTLEARLVHDADQIDMLLSLKEQHDIGNRDAEKWIPHVKARLRTAEARELAEDILGERWSGWWMKLLGV